MTLHRVKDTGPRVKRWVLKSVPPQLTQWHLVSLCPWGLSFPVHQTRMFMPHVIKSEVHSSLTSIYGINNLTKHEAGYYGKWTLGPQPQGSDNLLGGNTAHTEKWCWSITVQSCRFLSVPLCESSPAGAISVGHVRSFETHLVRWPPVLCGQQLFVFPTVL